MKLINIHILLSLVFFATYNNTWAQVPDSLEVVEFSFEDDPFAARLDSLLSSDLFEISSDNEFLNLDSTITTSADAPVFSDSVYRFRMEVINSKSPFDLVYNTEVRRYIDLYANRRREQVSRMLGLADYYFPMFEQILDKYDLPLELKYLAIVESALNPQARSRVGAKGLWQFMYATGKMNGLKIDSYVDERSDPYKSTEAACQYMMKLYDIFGDWNLVLAAYNSGPGNVNKAIRRSGGKRDYWQLRPYLPKETAGYVPAFIAVNYVMHYAPEHKLYATPSLYSFYDTDTICVKEQLSFSFIAKHLNIGEDVVAQLNPSYRYNIIPNWKDAPCTLVLPKEQMGLFISNEDTLYALVRIENTKVEAELPKEPIEETVVTHKVRSGETLGGIAKKYGVSMSNLKRWNNIRGTVIQKGQRLKIYKSGEPTRSKIATNSNSGSSTTYVVRSGDTLYDIAKRYPGVSADNIMKWNNIRSASSLRVGQKLVIHAL